MKNKITICICTNNRKKKLKKSLSSIRELNDIKKFNVEIVLISNDKLNYKKILTFFSKSLKIRFFRESISGVSTSRNKILEILRTEKSKYAAFIDDDCLVSKNWLVSMLDMLKKKNADIITGPQISKSNNIFLKLMERHQPHEIRTNWASTNNVFFKVSVLRNRIVFSNKLNHVGGEDQLFFLSLNKIGKKIFWNSKAPVFEMSNRNRENLRWFIKRNLRYGTSAVTIYKSLYGVVAGHFVLFIKLINDLKRLILCIIKLLFFSKKNFYLLIMYKMRILGLFMGLLGLQIKEY